MRDEFRAVHEEVAGIRAKVDELPRREEFDELRQDVKVIKAAVIDLSHQVNNHEHRVTQLETA